MKTSKNDIKLYSDGPDLDELDKDFGIQKCYILLYVDWVRKTKRLLS